MAASTSSADSSRLLKALLVKRKRTRSRSLSLSRTCQDHWPWHDVVLPVVLALAEAVGAALLALVVVEVVVTAIKLVPLKDLSGKRTSKRLPLAVALNFEC